MLPPLDTDVVVVGAGLAGLECARRLEESGLGVIVVEARERVGGRTWSVAADGTRWDLGAQFTGPGQDRIRGLAARYGLRAIRTPTAGRKVMDLDGRVSTWERGLPHVNPLSLVESGLTVLRLDQAARRVDLDDPLATPDAALLDRTSVEEWLSRRGYSRTMRRLVDLSVRTVLGAEPAELSLLHFLFYLRSGGGFSSHIEADGGAQQEHYEGGTQAIAEGLAAELRRPVALGEPVRAVEQHADGVSVVTTKRTIRARRVVIAVPPVLAARIDYSPALPVLREQLAQRMPMGATIKVIVRYREAWWRAAGFSGEILGTGGPIDASYDVSQPGRPALLGFITGAHAVRWGAAGAAARHAAVAAQLARCFGPRAAAFDDLLESDWSSDPWTRGAPVANFQPGAMTRLYPALRQPFGRVHWAGAETATRWAGYMEGALESGERAADEVRVRLGAPVAARMSA